LINRLLFLVVGIVLLAAAPAHAEITISNVQASPADVQAGAHSNFTLSFDLGGDESVRDLDIHMPPGLLGNPNAVGKCTSEQFDGDMCPEDSLVGTQTVNVTVGLLLPTDVGGRIYNLVPPEGKPALLGIILDTPPPGQKSFQRSEVRVRTESDSGLTSMLRDIPNESNGLPVKVNRISLTLNADGAKGAKFMTNPTSCKPAPTRLHAVGHSDGQADGEGGFTPTACEALPFAPKLSATIGASGATGAGSFPPLSTVITQAPGEANTASAKVTLMSPLSSNVNALANVCRVADFNANKCPPQSIVGQAEAVSPLLAAPLRGPVRIVENPDNLPKIVVYLNGLINIRLTGTVQLETAGTTTTFGGIADVPLSRFKLDFNGGPAGLVGTLEDMCTTPPKLGGEFTAHSGKTQTLTSTATVVGCPGVTGPGVTAPRPRPVASISLRRLATSSPLLRASAKRRKGGRRLRTLAITLPAGLSFDRGTLPVGVKSTVKRGVSLRGKRTLRLRTKSAKGAARIGVAVSRGALKVSPKLRRRVAKHPRVLVKLRVTDVRGRSYRLPKRVRLR
jgi:hypothetical protein